MYYGQLRSDLGISVFPSISKKTVIGMISVRDLKCCCVLEKRFYQEVVGIFCMYKPDCCMPLLTLASLEYVRQIVQIYGAVP